MKYKRILVDEAVVKDTDGCVNVETRRSSKRVVRIATMSVLLIRDQ